MYPFASVLLFRSVQQGWQNAVGEGERTFSFVPKAHESLEATRTCLKQFADEALKDVIGFHQKVLEDKDGSLRQAREFFSLHLSDCPLVSHIADYATIGW